MRAIILLAVIVMVALDATEVIPKSSVDGPMTMLLVIFAALLVLGIYEAWSRRRGMIGWILTIILAFAGGFVGMALAGLSMEMIVSRLALEGPLASSDHPFRYVSAGIMMLLPLLCSALTLKIVRRFWPGSHRSS